MPKILISLNRDRVTGTLSVTAQGMTKRVVFDNGNAIFATSTYDDDRLGEMLLKAGRIEVGQYDESVREMQRTGKRLGTVLVDLGYLTPKGLFWGVKYQVQEIIYSLFQFKDGLYEFIEGSPPKEIITLDLSMANIIYEGVRRIDDWTRIKSEMPDSDTVFVLSDDPVSLFQAVELNEQDKAILGLVNGSRSMKQIIEKIENSGLKSFDAVRSLYILWAIGMVVEGEGASEISLSLNDILRPVDDSKEKFIARVERTFGQLSGMSHYQLLEVDENADFKTISEQYYKLSKQFHPDRYAGSLDAELKLKATGIFDAITYAYESLKNSLLNPQYSEGDEALAEAMLENGKQEIKNGNFSEAEDYLREGLKYNPDNAECWNYLALALIRMNDRNTEAEKALLKAVDLAPENDDYITNLGLLFIKMRRLEEAKAQFERALGINANNDRAQQGLSKILIG